jgi:hypothetical protein
MKIIRSRLCTFVAGMASSAVTAASAVDLVAFSASSGGLAASGPFALHSVIGECVSGATVSGDSSVLTTGFITVSPSDLGCIGDLFPDGTVNGVDLGILLAQWGPASPATVSDLNRDGAVDGNDLGILLSAWGPCAT